MSHDIPFSPTAAGGSGSAGGGRQLLQETDWGRVHLVVDARGKLLTLGVEIWTPATRREMPAGCQACASSTPSPKPPIAPGQYVRMMDEEDVAGGQ